MAGNDKGRQGPLTQASQIKEYLSTHHVPQLMEGLMSCLMVELPQDHMKFLDSKLEDVKEIGIENVNWEKFVYDKHPLRDIDRNKVCKSVEPVVSHDPKSRPTSGVPPYKPEVFNLTEPDDENSLQDENEVRDDINAIQDSKPDSRSPSASVQQARIPQQPEESETLPQDEEELQSDDEDEITESYGDVTRGNIRDIIEQAADYLAHEIIQDVEENHIAKKLDSEEVEEENDEGIQEDDTEYAPLKTVEVIHVQKQENNEEAEDENQEQAMEQTVSPTSLPKEIPDIQDNELPQDTMSNQDNLDDDLVSAGSGQANDFGDLSD